MELKDFVSQSLIALMDGIGDAQKYAKDKGAHINPDIRNIHAPGIISNPNHFYYQVIEFDVAVSVDEQAQTQNEVNAGIGLKAASIQVIGLGATFHGEQKAQNVSVSRIKFSIPIELPKQ